MKEEHGSQDVHTVCEPAQSKCTSTCHKRHFSTEIYRKSDFVLRSKPTSEWTPCHGSCSWCFLVHATCEQQGDATASHPTALLNSTRRTLLYEPAQSKCTWTYHNSHFIWKFTGKVPGNRGADFVRACAIETQVNISEEPLYTEIYR